MYSLVAFSCGIRPAGVPHDCGALAGTEGHWRSLSLQSHLNFPVLFAFLSICMCASESVSTVWLLASAALLPFQRICSNLTWAGAMEAWKQKKNFPLRLLLSKKLAIFCSLYRFYNVLSGYLSWAYYIFLLSSSWAYYLFLLSSWPELHKQRKKLFRSLTSAALWSYSNAHMFKIFVVHVISFTLFIIYWS